MDAVHPSPPAEDPIVDLVPVVQRVVAARVADPGMRDDIVQETLARVMASRSRVEQDTLVPYAIVIARNLIASLAQREQRARRNAHLFVATDELEPRPDEELLRQEDASDRRGRGGSPAPGRAGDPGRARGGGTDTATLAAERGSTPGAVAGQLNRTRSRLRVEYLIAQTGRAADRPLSTDLDRPVAGNRRRQRELDSVVICWPVTSVRC